MRWIGAVLVVVGVLVLLLAGDVSAQTTTWLGGAGNWNDPAKWDNGVPTAASLVQIDDGNALASDVAVNIQAPLNSLTLDAGDQLRLLNGTRLNFQGVGSTLTNDNLIQHEGTGFTWIRLNNNDLDIDGSGTIRLNGGSNAINGFGNPTAPVLTHGANHTIEGAGGLGAGIDTVNQGLIDANRSGLSLTIGSVNSFSNSGTVRASNGGMVNMFSMNNTGSGTYEATGAGSAVLFFGGRIEGATFDGNAGGRITLDAFNLGRLLELQDVTNQGLYESADTNLLGSFLNSGEVRVLNAQTLAFESDFALTGGGTINLFQGGNIAGSFAMNNVDNTLAGFGDIDTASSFDAASMIAPGTTSDPTGIFDFNAAAVLGGTIAVDLGGIIVGGGAPNAGQVNRGIASQPGGTDFDQLNILMNPVDLDSSISFDVDLAGGFMPTVGDFFDVLTADQINVTSAPGFSFPTLPGVGFTQQVLTLFDPVAGVNRDVLRITAVPEPGALLLLACAGLAARRGRRATL